MFSQKIIFLLHGKKFCDDTLPTSIYVTAVINCGNLETTNDKQLPVTKQRLAPSWLSCICCRIFFPCTTKMVLNLNRGLITSIQTANLYAKDLLANSFSNLFSIVVKIFSLQRIKEKGWKGLIFHLFTLYNI